MNVPPHKGYKQTPEHVANKANARKGEKVQPEQIEKRKMYLKWSNLTPEQQQRNRDNLNRMIENNRGKHRSPETVAKIKESNKGKHNYPPEIRTKISDAAKDRHPSEETRRKMGESRKGEKNPRWLGGISFEPYCPKFTKEFKERVRAFFDHTCQVCGHVWQPGEVLLSVHHVNYNKQACCDGTNPLFVPVCAWGCHSKTNAHRDYWNTVFTNKIMLEHDGECYLPRSGVPA